MTKELLDQVDVTKLASAEQSDPLKLVHLPHSPSSFWALTLGGVGLPQFRRSWTHIKLP